jgi:hypothetical protein
MRTGPDSGAPVTLFLIKRCDLIRSFGRGRGASTSPSSAKGDPELSVVALVGAPSGGEVREANEKAAQKSHGRSSALNLKKRAMIAARGSPT